VAAAVDALVDTHAHLDFSAFDADREAVIARAAAAGVRWIVNPGADLESSRRAVRLAQQHEGVYAAVGVHPHEAQACTPATLAELRRLARQPKVVAIGEIGLDYYRDLSPRPAQRQAFRQQLELAAEVGLPVLIHDREAHEDILAILSESRPRGILHAFSGDLRMAQRVIALGLYIAVGGPITYQNARVLPALLPALPADRLVLETDCPYLTPHPYRGQRNEPAYLRLVAERLAELRGVSFAEMARQTTENARRALGIP